MSLTPSPLDLIFTQIASGVDQLVSQAATALIALTAGQPHLISERSAELELWTRDVRRLSPNPALASVLGERSHVSRDTQELLVAALLNATGKWSRKYKLSLRSNPLLVHSGLLGALTSLRSLTLTEPIPEVLGQIKAKGSLKTIILGGWSAELGADLEALIDRSSVTELTLEQFTYTDVIGIAHLPLTLALFLRNRAHRARLAELLLERPPHPHFSSGLIPQLVKGCVTFAPRDHLKWLWFAPGEEVKAKRGEYPHRSHNPWRERYQEEDAHDQRESPQERARFIIALSYASGHWSQQRELTVAHSSALFSSHRLGDLGHLKTLRLIELSSEELDQLDGLTALETLEVVHLQGSALSALISLINRAPQLKRISPKRLSRDTLLRLQTAPALSLLRSRLSLDEAWVESHLIIDQVIQLIELEGDQDITSQAITLLYHLEGCERELNERLGHLCEGCDLVRLSAGPPLRIFLRDHDELTLTFALVALLRAMGRWAELQSLQIVGRLNPHLHALGFYDELDHLKQIEISRLSEALLHDLVSAPLLVERLERESRGLISSPSLSAHCERSLYHLEMSSELRRSLTLIGSRLLSETSLAQDVPDSSRRYAEYELLRCKVDAHLSLDSGHEEVAEPGVIKSEVARELWVSARLIPYSMWRAQLSGLKRPLKMDWVDCAYLCNALSERARLKPVYHFDEALRYGVSIDLSASGYRMLTEREWERVAPQLIRSAQAHLIERDQAQQMAREITRLLIAQGEEIDQQKNTLRMIRERVDRPGEKTLEWCNDLWEETSLKAPLRVCRGDDHHLRRGASPLKARSGHPQVRSRDEELRFGLRICREVSSS